MPLVSCPSCHTADALVGVDDADGKLVACGTCGHRWRRDLTPTCRLCGSTDLEPVATSTLEEAGRGEQRTPSGIRTTYRCWACGARDATSSAPIPAGAGWRAARETRVRTPGGTDEGTGREDQGAPPRRVESTFGVFEEGRTVGGRWRLESLLRWSSTGTVWAAADVTGEGVAALHRHGLAHLGIRPDKLLRGPEGPVRLIDFGSDRVRARTTTDRYEDERMAWQAPEQIVAGQHGTAADVYSLALTLWAIAGGDFVELGVNAPARARHRLQHDLPPLPPHGGTPASLRDAIAAAGRRRPEDRPTARAFTDLIS